MLEYARTTGEGRKGREQTDAAGGAIVPVVIDVAGSAGAAVPTIGLGARGAIATARGLTISEAAEAELVARRLHAEFRPILSAMPAEHRAASAMSRALGVDRATCQRLVGVLAKSEVSARTLVELPGVEGLNLVLEAVRKRKWASGEQLATANAAVDRMAELLDALGGSQRKLKERIEARGIAPAAHIGTTPTDPGTGPVDDEDARRALHDAARALTGRWSECMLSVRFIRPLANDPLMTETAILRGLIGHVATARSMPLEIGGVMPLRAPAGGSPGASAASPLSSFDARPASGSTPGVLLREFCSDPLPRVVSHSMGPRVAHVIDTPESMFGKPADIVIGTRGSRPDAHPASKNPPLGEIWSMVNFPARALVFDTYLHRDIARKCIPGLSAHLWSPDVLQPAASRWSTRLPGGPRLHLLEPGPESAGTVYYPRMAELTARTFELLGWSRTDFIGYRCETTYPVWRGGYCMAFDFTGNELSPK